MAESELHRRLKYAMAKELVEMGYQSGVEVPIEVQGKSGYIDVQGRRGNEIINIELWKTHIPDWLIIKFQEAREIRENIYTELLIKVSENYTKVFSIEVLVNGLVESGYFNDGSANKYVDKMIKKGEIVIHEAKEIKELFIEIAKRLSASAYGLLDRDELIKGLVDSGSFDNESAAEYVNKMSDLGVIVEYPDVYFNEEQQRHICECEDFRLTQKECSHIEDHKHRTFERFKLYKLPVGRQRNKAMRELHLLDTKDVPNIITTYEELMNGRSGH